MNMLVIPANIILAILRKIHLMNSSSAVLKFKMCSVYLFNYVKFPNRGELSGIKPLSEFGYKIFQILLYV